MADGSSPTDLDDDLRDRLKRGDAAAIAALVKRDHAVAELLARVLANTDGPGDAVAQAWESLLSDTASGDSVGGLRCALLSRVVDALVRADALDRREVPAPPSAGPFVPAGDDQRWAGWWVGDPVPWPAGTAPDSAQVERALRQLPLAHRMMLVLLDTAGVSAEDARRVLAGVGQQLVSLESARDAFVVYLDREVRSERGRADV